MHLLILTVLLPVYVDIYVYFLCSNFYVLFRRTGLPLLLAKFNKCFGSGTDPISLLILLFLFYVQKRIRLRHFKSDQDEIWQDCSSCKYMHRLLESDL